MLHPIFGQLPDPGVPLPGLRKPFTAEEAHALWVAAFREGLQPELMGLLDLLDPRWSEQTTGYAFTSAQALANFLNLALTESIR
jgi:hypothetical protein